MGLGVLDFWGGTEYFGVGWGMGRLDLPVDSRGGRRRRMGLSSWGCMIDGLSSSCYGEYLSVLFVFMLCASA